MWWWSPKKSRGYEFFRRKIAGKSFKKLGVKLSTVLRHDGEVKGTKCLAATLFAATDNWGNKLEGRYPVSFGD